MSWTKNTPAVYVGGLGREVGEEQLEEIFSMLGKVEKEKEGGSKGYGFVTFQDEIVSNNDEKMLQDAVD